MCISKHRGIALKYTNQNPDVVGFLTFEMVL